MKMHQQKLQAISLNKVEFKSKCVPLVQETRKEEKHLKKARADKLKSVQFVNSERNSAINKDNQILLSKLVEISSGKHCSVPKPLHPAS